MKYIISILICLVGLPLLAQTKIGNLFAAKKYAEIVDYKGDLGKLSDKDILLIAKSHFQLKNDSSALYYAEYLIDKKFANSEVYFLKGVILTNRGEFREATDYFAQALVYDRNRLPILLEKGAAFYKANMLDSALNVYSRTHFMYPHNQNSGLMTCQIYDELNQNEEAYQCYYDLLEKLKNDDMEKDALTSLVRISWHRMKQYQNTEKILNYYRKKFPQDTDGLLLMLQFYSETKQWEKFNESLLEMKALYFATKLNGSFYKKGEFPICDIEVNNYRIQGYEVFDPSKKQNLTRQIYMVTPQNGIPLGRLKMFEIGDTIKIQSEGQIPKVDTVFQSNKWSDFIEFSKKTMAN